MGKITFITGGARAGKSSFALREADKISGKKAYIATLQPLDDEMRERVKMHKSERSKQWDVYEEPINAASLIKKLSKGYSVILIDCLTLWLSNIMLLGRDMESEIEDLVSAIKESNSIRLFIVSNEVGMGIVPEAEIARKFRDWAGILNQKTAGVSDEVYMVTAGIPMKIKGQ